MKNIRKSILFVGLIILSLIFVSCDFQPSDTGKENPEEMITIKHELGEEKVKKNPERIIVFDYGILDALDNIGIDVIGVAKQSLPAYLDKYKADEYVDIGSLKEPNFETIYEINPGLIIISGRQGDIYDELRKIAPTVYLNIDGGDYLNSFKSNMEILGKMFDREDLLKEKVEEITEAIDKLHEKAQSIDKNGLFIMANDGNLSAYGLGSRFGVLHKEFGVKAADENIDASTHGQKITFEYIVETDPD
ncbi:MAG TPA: ABC transporter substrate-binding protein [Tissierellaceae bacterium]|nr:ABC transporter substrate-binding protein [Tissierellaceae bacterium]